MEIDRNAPVQTKAARNNVNRLLYNGKELQVGTGLLDYGARMYMPEIGQMGSIDGAAHFMTMILPGGFSPTFRPGPTTIPRMTSLAIPVAYNALDTYLKGPSAIEHIAQLLKGMGVPSDLLRAPAIRNAKPTPKNNREEFIKLPGNQGWVNKKTGEIYKKSHISHGNLGNVPTVIDIKDLEKDFLNDLEEEGYEDMLKEYLK